VSSVVASWDLRAAAYDALTGRQPLFETMARRLLGMLGVAALPDGARLLDVGGGSGLVSALALAEAPGLRVVLAEPAAAMRQRAVARLERFGGRVRVVASAAEELAAAEVRAAGEPDAAAAVSSATMHLVELEPALAAVAGCLAPGGGFAFNLWWHAWAETAGEEVPGWRAPVEAALAALGEEVPVWPERPRSAPLDAARLAAAAGSAGLEQVAAAIDRDPVPGGFFVEFAAMDPGFLRDLPAPRREAVLERAVALAQTVEVATVRFLLRRR
jgi:SAM-dependent methyltransferase